MPRTRPSFFAPPTGRCIAQRRSGAIASSPPDRPELREVLIDALTPKQRAHLRSLAHHLKAILQVGKEGVTDTAVRAIEDAFNTRELLKVKVQEAAPLSAREAGAELARRIEGVHHVQTIGRTVVLYRADPEKPEIRLPA